MTAGTSLRSTESEDSYQDAKKAGESRPLDKEPRLLKWKHWYLIANRFPYDMAFSENDMLLPKSGAANRHDLTLAEFLELQDILDELKDTYDMVLENLYHRRSVPNIYHLHMVRFYKSRRENRL